MKPKGKEAYHNLGEIANETGTIIELLIKSRETLSDIIDDDESKKIGGETLEGNVRKMRSMIHGIPPRLEFCSCNLRFYIDFTVVASERDDRGFTKGSIIYGTSRTLCFTKVEKPREDKTEDQCQSCQCVGRCDKLEDKPLIDLLVNRSGMIKSRGNLEGEWCIGNDSEATDDNDLSKIVELHFRALNHIWKDALDWANEIILP